MQVYYGNRCKFIISGERIYYEDSFIRLYLAPKESYWRKHLNFVRVLIELGEIVDYASLVEYCKGRIDIYPTYQQPAIRKFKRI